MLLNLKRISSSKHGTYGVLLHGQAPICLTLELPWLDNQKNISCIPIGLYDVLPYSSKKYPDAYSVQNVPDRTNILLHGGNNLSHTQGCILLGSTLTSNGIAQYKPSLSLLRHITPHSFQLLISRV